MAIKYFCPTPPCCYPTTGLLEADVVPPPHLGCGGKSEKSGMTSLGVPRVACPIAVERGGGGAAGRVECRRWRWRPCLQATAGEPRETLVHHGPLMPRVRRADSRSFAPALVWATIIGATHPQLPIFSQRSHAAVHRVAGDEKALSPGTPHEAHRPSNTPWHMHGRELVHVLDEPLL